VKSDEQNYFRECENCFVELPSQQKGEKPQRFCNDDCRLIHRGEIYSEVKTTAKKIIIITAVIGIIISSLLIYRYWTVWRFDRINLMANTQVTHLNDYRDYFYKVVFRPNTRPAPFGSSRHIIYFLPGQRQKMLERVEEDIIHLLDMLVGQYSHVFYKYEIIDDFRHVRIYETPWGIGRSGFFHLRPGVIRRIQSLIGFYNSVRLGRPASMPTNFTFEIIEHSNAYEDESLW